MSGAHDDGGRVALLIAAVGGQGGAVLTDWIVHAAEAAGLAVQATSLPGVSQRTGATTYYVEMVRQSPVPPVFALMPMPGRVDVLVASELLEGARMLERGFVTPVRTTVIASTHRVYTTREKMGAGDGRFDGARVAGAIAALARRTVLFDMEAIGARHGSAISAALFGALAGCGALPIARAHCEAAIRAAGKGVAASLAAFAEAFASAAATLAESRTPVAASAAPATAEADARFASLPPAVAAVAQAGAARATGFQDGAYAQRYVERVMRIARTEAALADAQEMAVTREVARRLALWMCYDDIVRVAQLKARRSRIAGIAQRAGARDGDVVRVYDIFHPGRDEVSAILPGVLGAWLARRAGTSPRKGRGLRLLTNSVTGALALRALCLLRPLRPRSLRYVAEQAEIDAWLDAVEHALRQADAAAARVIAALPRLRKGYGDTQAAGVARFRECLSACRERGDSGIAHAAAALDDLQKAAPAGARPVPVVTAPRSR